MASYVQRAVDSITGFGQRYEKFSKLLTIRQYAKGSITGYCSKIARLCLVYNKLPEDLCEDEISAYLYGLQQRVPYPGYSEFVHVKAGLGCYYNLMGFVSKKIMLPPLRKKHTLPVVLSTKEMWDLLRVTTDHREKLILALLYSLGLRKSELLRMEVRDIDTDRRRVHVRQSKGCKDRYIPLAESVIPLINRYRKEYNPTRYLFYASRVGDPTPGREVTGVLQRALIRTGCRKKVVCHTLRHTFATHALETGTSIVSVKELLGHSSLQSTMVYLHIANLPDNPPPNPLDHLCALYGKKK